MGGHETDFESELRVALDLSFERENLEFFLCTLHVEDGRGAQLVLNVNCAVFSL